jgi:hypothetical protein
MAARILAKRGDGGPSMPLRAFSIASLVLGAGCCAMGGTLWASGIREVGIFNFVLLLSPPESSRISYVVIFVQRFRIRLHSPTTRNPNSFQIVCPLTLGLLLMQVEDLRSMGRTIRSAFGKPPRTHV